MNTSILNALIPAHLALLVTNLVALVRRDAGAYVAAELADATTVGELLGCDRWLMADCGLDAGDTCDAIMELHHALRAHAGDTLRMPARSECL